VPVALRERLRAARVREDDLAALDAEIPPQAVHVPFVNVRDGSAFVRLLHFADDPRGARADAVGFEAGARVAVEDGLQHALARIGHPKASGYAFVPLRVGVLGRADVHGDSLGAGAYVSARARFDRRAVLAGTVVTGSILHGRVTSVGGMEAKVRALRDRPDLLRFVVPAEDHRVALTIAGDLGVTQEILAAATFDDLDRLCLEPEPRPLEQPEAAVDAAKAAIDRGWQEWRWPSLRDRMDRLVDELPSDALELRVRAMTMLGVAHRNAGEPDDAAAVLEEAAALLELRDAQWGVSDRWRSYLHRHRAMTALQLGWLDEAQRAGERARETAERARHRDGFSVALGVLGHVALARGDAAEAVRLHRASVEQIDPGSPERVPRPLSHLIEALGAQGELDEARRVYHDVQARMHALGPTPRVENEREWVGQAMLSAYVRAGAYEEALTLGRDPAVVRALREVPMPGLRIRRWLGLAEVQAGDRARGYRLLGDSPQAYRVRLGARNGFTAAVNVLHEKALRLQHGDFGPGEASELERTLRDLGYSDSVGATLSPAMGEVVVALGEAASAGAGEGAYPGLEPAVARLIDVCERFG